MSFDNLLIKHYPGFLLQENQYYPFGLLNKALSSDEQKGFNQRYGFNGKEFEKGLDWRMNIFWISCSLPSLKFLQKGSFRVA